MAMKLLTIAEIRQEHLTNLSEQRIYSLVREGILPPGVVVRLDRQVRINEGRLVEFLERGGAALPGGWRREARDKTEQGRDIPKFRAEL